MICGLSDIEDAGNQSMKNGIKYLSLAGYSLHVFTFLPRHFRNLQDPSTVFDNNVVFHRLPAFLIPLMDILRRLKTGLHQLPLLRVDTAHLTPSQAVDYHDEHGPLLRFLYILFLYLVYLPFECLRVTWVILNKGKPDLFYGLNCQGAVLAGLLGRLCGCPTITRFHGTDLTEAILKSKRLRLLLFDQVAGLKVKSDAVIMTNDGTRGDVILQRLGVAPTKIRYWMNGVDTDDLRWPAADVLDQARRSLNLQHQKVLLMVSRLVVWKRVERGIYCLHQLRKHPSVGEVVLIIIGDGPEQASLSTYAEMLGVSSSVKFLGRVSHKAISPYYLLADAFMSLYDRTNLGNPLLEAMYFGRPIVTIKDASTDHLLRDGENAFLISPLNIETELPARVELLLSDSDLRMRIGKRIQSTFHDKVHSWQQRMELEQDLIQQVLNPPSVDAKSL